MGLSAIVTCHDDARGLTRILSVLACQTRPPDETIALTSGILYPSSDGWEDEWPHVDFHDELDHADWGHEKRAKGLTLAAEEYVAFFNHDDGYDPRFIARMLQLAEGNDADVVFCWWPLECRFESGSSTSGNYIVRAELARAAGYTDRHYEADGAFIDRLVAAGAHTVECPEPLYMHNLY